MQLFLRALRDLAPYMLLGLGIGILGGLTHLGSGAIALAAFTAALVLSGVITWARRGRR